MFASRCKWAVALTGTIVVFGISQLHYKLEPGIIYIVAKAGVAWRKQELMGIQLADLLTSNQRFCAVVNAILRVFCFLLELKQSQPWVRSEQVLYR